MPTLNWIGKEAVANHHHQVPFHLLKDVPNLACGEPGDGNLIVQGSNVLTQLVLAELPQVRWAESDLLCRMLIGERSAAGGAHSRSSDAV